MTRSTKVWGGGRRLIFNGLLSFKFFVSQVFVGVYVEFEKLIKIQGLLLLDDHFVTTWHWPLHKSFFNCEFCLRTYGIQPNIQIETSNFKITKVQKVGRGRRGPSGPGLLKGTFFLSITSKKKLHFPLLWIEYILIEPLWATFSDVTKSKHQTNEQKEMGFEQPVFFSIKWKMSPKTDFRKVTLCK